MLDTMSRQERRLLSREGTAWHIEVSHWCVLRRHIQGGTGTVLSAVDSFRTLWWRGVSCHVRADDAENARVVSSGVCNNAQSCSGICPWERNGTLSKRPLLLFRRCSAASQSLVSLLPGGVLVKRVNKLCHVCRHCCVHGQWLPDMQKPHTHGAASVPIKFRLTISVRTWLVT